VDRLRSKRYGNRLTVNFIDRRDQIFFKFFAAVDRGGPSYHLDDLLALEPSAIELEAAFEWTMLQDPSEGFAQTANAFLRFLGHETIADKF